MLNFAIIMLAMFVVISFMIWRLSVRNKLGRVNNIVHIFHSAAKYHPSDESTAITYTGPQNIGTDLIGIGFTVNWSFAPGQKTNNERENLCSRLSVSLNAGKRKPWWVLYEVFKIDEVSGAMVRVERHTAEFCSNTGTAACLETLRKAASGELSPPAPCESKVDPFEMPPDSNQ
jgi:hypothetical protein